MIEQYLNTVQRERMFVLVIALLFALSLTHRAIAELPDVSNLVPKIGVTVEPLTDSSRAR